MTVLVMVAILGFGIASYFKLPTSDLPVVDYPVMTITVSYPGASPSLMASGVAAPLENECMQIEGLQSVISDNTEGQTVITLTFDLNRSVDLAAPDVQAAISRAAANLPPDLPEPPYYQKVNPSDAPIVYLMVSSETMTPGQLYDYANLRIGQRMTMIEGVSKVQIYGAKGAVRVQVDPNKLASYKIGINEVANAVKTGTVLIPGGSLDGKFRTFSLEPQGQLFKAKDYEKIIVAYRNGAPVYLKDIAKCIDSTDNDVTRLRYGAGGEELVTGSICIAISRQAGANTVLLSETIRETLEEIKKVLPGSITVDIFYDKAETILDSIKDVKRTIFIAIALVVMVIFIFLGRLSDTIIPSIILPISIFGTFGIMLVMGFSLDNLSLMGIILSVGFLVDDAIVVLENSVRHIEAGEKPLQATIKSMKEITGTIISTSLALIIVFVPIVFMSGVVGRNFNEFALTVVAAILCSGVISLTLTPMMCARMLKPQKKDGKTKLQQWTDRFVGGIRDKYAVWLKWVLKRKYISLLIWAACLLGTILFFAITPKTFMPIGDSGLIMGQMVAQQGTSTEQIRKFQDKVDKIMNQDPATERAFTVTGIQPGADQSTAFVIARLKPRSKRGPIEKVVDRFNAAFYEIPDGFTFIEALPSLKLSTGGESTATGDNYSYVLVGTDREQLYKAAQELEDTMYTLPGFTGIQSSVKLDMPQLDIEILRDRASTLGVTAEDIELALSLAYAQGRVTLYKTDSDQYDVIVEFDKSYERRPENLSHLYVLSGTTNKLVPLNSLVKWKQTVGPQDVPHNNQMNSATISFNLESHVPLGNATKALEAAAAEILPEGVTGTFQGQAQEFESAVKSLSVLLLISVFLMYIILGVLYESYVHPFTILTTLPVAAFGGLLTVLLFGQQLSLYAYIGMFMLLGIVAKNGIMMVNFAEQNLTEKNVTNMEAIYNACLVRFRPILMTSASAIMGALPVAFGFGADGPSRIPLGLIIVGGLAFAQIVTLFATPGIFLYMQDFQVKVLDRFEISRSKAARSAVEAAG